MGVFGALCDGAQLLRQAQAYLRETAARRAARDADPAAAGMSMLVQTADGGSYPTVAQAVYLCTPLELDADDTEGATASPTGDTTQNAFIVNLGSSVPPVGTMVIAHAVGGRWVMRYDG